MNKKLIFGAFALVALVGLLTYLWNKNSNNILIQPDGAVSGDQVAVALIPDWNSCSYPGFGFSVQYPPDWKASFISGAQGAGGAAIVAGCGEIDARSLLPEITFGGNGQSMKLTIRDKKGESVSRAEAHGQLQKSGSTVYAGKQYSIVFSDSVSADTRLKILSTFDFPY